MSSSFKPNPLSLSVPDPALDRWLRDSGYLDLLDSSAPAPAAAAPTRASPASTSSGAGAAADVLAFARTLASLLALNPFACLSAADLAAPTPSWSLAFIGAPGVASYSWPPTPTQARLRVQENVRRYARNYAALSVLVFACCLYRMPMSLLGLLASLAVWEAVRYCRKRWELATRAPGIGQALLHCAQIATAILLYVCNLQFALVYTIGLSYAVMMLHASLRKLTPSSLSVPANKNRRAQPRRS
ncbi:PRA1 family protein H-like [Triticum dicoccoides]|uniref:PRA1 family protein H-like n=1 Tax=Triticum dicoccoides TaxID=85692 RepID=UPI00188FFB24|nr:PRA1 family protein H-like [Triticum dicoccoides]